MRLEFVSPRQHLLEVHDALGRAPWWKHEAHAAVELRIRYQRFFADLDRRTAPHLARVFARMATDGDLESDPVDATVAEMTAVAVPNALTCLSTRLRNRSRAPIGAGAPEAPRAVVSAYESEAKFISWLFLELACRHFPGRQNSVDVGEFEAAIENFAIGELRFQIACGDWTTEPSSGYFFFLAEMGLLAHSLDIDRVAWEPLINVMVRCQPAFAAVYGPSSSKARPGLADYSADNYSPDVARAIRLDGRLARLRQEFAGASITELERASASHAKQYLTALEG